jgi:hypothetical protein
MQQRPYDAFREALLDLSDEPSPVNVLRYLAASRTLAHASTNTAPGKAGAGGTARTGRGERAPALK